MLKIPQSAYVSLRQHGEETYPHECCGVLLGRFEDDGSKTVSHVAPCSNTRVDSPQNRYSIDPRELIRIQREGRERGEDIVALCGRNKILERARELKNATQLKRALALAEIALNANPTDIDAIILNAEILEAMAAAERSFIARNFFAGAARQLRERGK